MHGFQNVGGGYRGFYLNLWVPSSSEQSELSDKNPRPGLIVLKALKALAVNNGNKILSKLIPSNKDRSMIYMLRAAVQNFISSTAMTKQPSDELTCICDKR